MSKDSTIKGGRSGWVTKRIGDITKKVGSGITPKGGSTVYKSSGRPFVRSQNVGWGRLRLDDLAFIDEKTHDRFSGSELQAGDVLLNITGASIGRASVADDRVAGGNVNQHVCIVRTKKNEVVPDFLAAVLLSSVGQDQIDSFQAGGNREGLNFGQIRSIEFECPEPKEQRAIAGVLSDVDALIESLDTLIAKKRDLKQATMQQLLTGKKRLSGFSGKWSDTTVANLGKLKKGGGIPKSAVTTNGLPCILYGEIYTRYGEITEKLQSRIPSEVAAGAVPLRQGDVVFAGSGETLEDIGKCVAYVGERPAFAGGDTLILRPSGHNSSFLGYLLNSNWVNQQKASRGQGSSVVHLYGRDLKTIEFTIPEKEEQTAIAHVISDMDAEIDALIARRDKTKLLKTGLMQELLSGRRRLV